MKITIAAIIMAITPPAVALFMVLCPFFFDLYGMIGHHVRFDHLSFLMKLANDAALLVFYVLLELFVSRRSEVNPKVLQNSNHNPIAENR